MLSFIMGLTGLNQTKLLIGAIAIVGIISLAGAVKFLSMKVDKVQAEKAIVELALEEEKGKSMILSKQAAAVDEINSRLTRTVNALRRTLDTEKAKFAELEKRNADVAIWSATPLPVVLLQANSDNGK